MRQGVVRLPPGFRFHPTDEELVVQYLKRKVFCCPLPASIIPEIGLSKYDPWDLPGERSGLPPTPLLCVVLGFSKRGERQ